MMRRYVRYVLFLVLAGFGFFVYGCGGGGGSLTPDTNSQPSRLILSISDNYKVVKPDGTTTIPITARVYNNNGNLISNVNVQITSDPVGVGSFDAQIKTTHSGAATFYYTVPSYDVADEYSLTGIKFTASVLGYSSASGSNDISFQVFLSKIAAVIPDNSTLLPADSSITVPVTVYVYGGDGSPLSGVSIYSYVSPNVGHFDKLVSSTSSDGIAAFTYTLPSKNDMLKVNDNKVVLTFKDKTGKVEDNATIHFSNVNVGSGLPAAAMLEAQPSSLFTSNVSSGPKLSQIIANVVDGSGSPVPDGYTVKFSLQKNPNGSCLKNPNDPNNTCLTNEEVPVKNGVAIADFVSGTEAGIALIKAEVEGWSTVESSVSISIEGGEANSITLLTSGKITANDDNGTREMNVYAFVKDSDGNPVADGTIVQFNTNDSCGGMVSPNIAKTSKGVAEAKLSYPAACIWKGYVISADSENGITASLSGDYPAVSPVKLALSGPTTISASGGNINVYLELKDEGGSGLPISNANVKMYSTLDNVTFNPQNVITDDTGQGYTTVYIPQNTVIVNPDNTTTSESRTITITGQVGSSIGSLNITQQKP